MKHYLFLLLLLLLSSASNELHATSCDGIAEGTVVRLDTPDGPLSKAHVQDQDGLGTCYANQASIMLQGVLPGNPNISYLNLALYYAKDYSHFDDQNNFSKSIKTPNGLMEANLVDGGFGCRAIDSAIKRQKSLGPKQGVLCQSIHTALEHSFFNEYQNGYIDQESRQGQVITAASKYYGSYLKTFGIDSNKKRNIKMRHEADAFAQALNSFVTANISDFGKNHCTKPDPEKIEQLISNAITKTLDHYPQCLTNGRLNRSLDECKVYDSLGVITNLNGPNGRTIGYFMGGYLRKQLQTQLPALMSKSSSSKDLQHHLVGFLAENLTSQIPSKTKKKFAENLAGYFGAYEKNALSDEFERVVKGDINKCINSQFLEFFKDKDNFVTKAKSQKLLCDHTELIDNAHLLATTLPDGAIKSIGDFMDLLILKDAKLDYDSTLIDVVANDCQLSDRIYIPSTVSCKETTLNIKPKVANNPEKMEAVIMKSRKEMFSRINSNLPVGLDLCTRYWTDASFEFNKIPENQKFDKCRESGVHGLHAITMIGYRCQNNKVQYLAQNSWGPHWELNDKRFEIEQGKIWLDEETLFMNMVRYSTITK